MWGRTTEFVNEAQRGPGSLSDDEALELARHATTIEEHCGRSLDIEWGKEGVDGRTYILQARAETVQSRRSALTTSRYRLAGKDWGRRPLVDWRATGQKIGSGAVKVLSSVDQMASFEKGQVLVADMTDPDWEPIMKRASGIVTNRGGRACHAAIIARELGIPAVVGTGSAEQGRRPPAARVHQCRCVAMKGVEGRRGIERAAGRPVMRGLGVHGDALEDVRSRS